jgi:hypothetical protein
VRCADGTATLSAPAASWSRCCPSGSRARPMRSAESSPPARDDGSVAPRVAPELTRRTAPRPPRRPPRGPTATPNVGLCRRPSPGTGRHVKTGHPIEGRRSRGPLIAEVVRRPGSLSWQSSGSLISRAVYGFGEAWARCRLIVGRGAQGEPERVPRHPHQRPMACRLPLDGFRSRGGRHPRLPLRSHDERVDSAQRADHPG